MFDVPAQRGIAADAIYNSVEVFLLILFFLSDVFM